MYKANHLTNTLKEYKIYSVDTLQVICVFTLHSECTFEHRHRHHMVIFSHTHQFVILIYNIFSHSLNNNQPTAAKCDSQQHH